MPRRRSGSGPANRWRAAAGVVLASIAAHSPALAYTFNLTSDGSGQYLTCLWECCSPTISCVYPSFRCCNESSVNGRIALTYHKDPCVLAGGMLNWTGSPGSLLVVAMPTVAANVNFPGGGCQYFANAWAAVNARDNPMVFLLSADSGDPPTTNLRIEPRLLGNIGQFTHPGSSQNLILQLMMSVAVNGQVVSRDSLFGEFPLSDGAQANWSPAFPKGAANEVTLPGVAVGSQVSITLWAYMQAWPTGPGYIYASSSYGEGPAIVVEAQASDVVAVPGEVRPDGLRLAAHPNPSPGATRILYTLPRPSRLRLTVYDMAGSRVATLVDQIEAAGRGELVWNARGSRGERLAPGVYMMELVAGSERTVGKLVILGQ